MRSVGRYKPIRQTAGIAPSAESPTAELLHKCGSVVKVEAVLPVTCIGTAKRPGISPIPSTPGAGTVDLEIRLGGVHLQKPATSDFVAIGNISVKGRRHYLLNVVQVPLIGHNQAAPRTPLESPCMARTMGVPASAEKV